MLERTNLMQLIRSDIWVELQLELLKHLDEVTDDLTKRDFRAFFNNE
jgi:hypothetical protein